MIRLLRFTQPILKASGNQLPRRALKELKKLIASPTGASCC